MKNGETYPKEVIQAGIRHDKGWKWAAWMVALAMTLSASLLPAAAYADEELGDPDVQPMVSYVHHVLDKVRTTNYLGSQVFASCTVGTAGGTCSITSGKSVTRTISLTLGASRGYVSGQLNISSAQSVSTSVSCTSPPLAAGASWRARAYGDRFTYKIRRYTYYNGNIPPTVETSGTLSAFNPYSSHIYCY